LIGGGFLVAAVPRFERAHEPAEQRRAHRRLRTAMIFVSIAILAIGGVALITAALRFNWVRFFVGS
jgi:hypothetical protein